MKTLISLILLKMRLFVLCLVQKWHNFWGEESRKDMHQSGELIVVKEGEVKIDLESHPISVKVYFDGDPMPVPCNPHHHDHLHWHIENSHHHHPHDRKHEHRDHRDAFFLVINWKVHNVRAIKWTVHY